MLSDEVIEKVTERLINRIEQANTYVLKEIGKSIKQFNTLSLYKANQLINVLKYGGNYEKIVKKLAEITELNVYEIFTIFEEIAKSDYKFAEQFYKYRNINYIPWEQNYALQQQVTALATITANKYLNLTKTSALGFGWIDKEGNITFKGIQQTYYDLLDEAVLSISQGKEGFNSAMYRQLKNIGESGLKVVYPTTYVDKNGNIKHYTRRLDSAIRMNIDSAISNLHNTIQEQIGEEFGADGVELSVHQNSAEDHQEAQGKQFSIEEFNKLQSTGIAMTYDGKIIDMHINTNFRPISDYNCKHYTFSIILGVNKPQYSNKKLKEIIDSNNKGFEYEGKHYTNYEGTQLQRKIETEIRKQKDLQIMGKAANNIELIDKAQKKITQLTRKYKELSNVSGLPTKMQRLRVPNYRRVNVSTFEKNLKK